MQTRLQVSSWRGDRSRADCGSVTAEAAVVLPVIAAFILSLVWMVAIGLAQVQVVDAARDAARSLARGDSETTAIAAARATAPHGADVTVSYVGSRVSVVVSVSETGPGWLLAPLPAMTVRSESTVEVESGVDGPA